MLDENCEQVRRFADPDALNKIGAQHYRMSRTRLLHCAEFCTRPESARCTRIGATHLRSPTCTHVRRQAPTGRHANPTLVGWLG